MFLARIRNIVKFVLGDQHDDRWYHDQRHYKRCNETKQCKLVVMEMKVDLQQGREKTIHRTVVFRVVVLDILLEK